MKIIPIKTHKIRFGKETIFNVLDKYLTKMQEKSILAVTSKIISICEGRIIKIDMTDKSKLIEKEADLFVPPDKDKYNYHLTIKRNLLVFAAGIDESNGYGNYILWPKNPQKNANEIREYLQKKFLIKNMGVIITDSRTSPLRFGTTGFALTHSGFAALKSYIGRSDIFGRKLKLQKVNMADSLAASAVTTMGEGNEQTPLALIEDVPFVAFQNRNPKNIELAKYNIAMKDDLYAPIMQKIHWKSNKS